MVLHDNKWDRRAKHRYLQKHGLSEPRAPATPKPDVAPPVEVLQMLPDFEDDDDVEALLAASRTPRAAPAPVAEPGPEQQPSARQALFAEAEARVERGKLNHDVRTRLRQRGAWREQRAAGSGRDAPISHIPEQDIDEFLSAADSGRGILSPQDPGARVRDESQYSDNESSDNEPPPGGTAIDSAQEAFLDSLL